jgi:Asp-tRNAAsn/Glu-tRNAGln amidotransferase A subunit and related amidases
MHRRSFLKDTSLATLILPKIALSTADHFSVLNTENDTTNLVEATIDDLQQLMKAGKITSKQLTAFYLKRIQEIDKNGPHLNSVIEVNPDALMIAEKADQDRKNGKTKGPLHGIPVLIKDNINTGDKMQTTAGSLALEGHKAKQDAFIIKRLRESGAVLLGKTNLSEWANFRSTRSSSGWSSRGGQTNNPYNPSRNPCGSSSGSGVAVSANLCAIAIGTETDGSIVCPSSINGVVGIKPTVGLWSRSGIIPISHTQDTAGPMARTVKDAAILLSHLTGIDTNDVATNASDGNTSQDYTSFLNAGALKGKRIGIEKTLLKGHEAIDALFQKAIQVMKEAGAEIIEVDVMSKVKEIGDSEFQVLLFEFKNDLNKYLAQEEWKLRTLQDIIDFNKANEAKVMPYFKQEIMESAQKKGDLGSKEYQEALQKNFTVARGSIDGALKEFNLDAICGPTTGPSWCTDLVNGDHFAGYETSTPGAVAGYPHVTVPMGFVFGLPIGISFYGTAWTEGKLISIAYAYEQLTHNRKTPNYKV